MRRSHRSPGSAPASHSSSASTMSTGVNAPVYLYPIAETGLDCLGEVVKHKPLCDDPDCWEVCEDVTLLVVEDDRDAIYLKLLALEPINGQDGCSVLDPCEAAVPAHQRLEVEEAVRSQFRGRHAWFRLLCVRFEDDADRRPFEDAMAKLTGIPLTRGVDGSREHDTFAVFDLAARSTSRSRSVAQIARNVAAAAQSGGQLSQQ